MLDFDRDCLPSPDSKKAYCKHCCTCELLPDSVQQQQGQNSIVSTTMFEQGLSEQHDVPCMHLAMLAHV